MNCLFLPFRWTNCFKNVFFICNFKHLICQISRKWKNGTIFFQIKIESFILAFSISIIWLHILHKVISFGKIIIRSSLNFSFLVISLISIHDQPLKPHSRAKCDLSKWGKHWNLKMSHNSFSLRCYNSVKYIFCGWTLMRDLRFNIIFCCDDSA